MSKFRKITISVLSIILVVLISFTLPVQVAATATPDEVEGLADSESIQQEDATSEGNIIGEDTSKRDEYTKHFITDAGTTIAAQYAVPVHYKDANGEYVDFDNSLVSSQVTISEATEDEVTADEVSAYSLRTIEETEDTFTNKKSNSKVSHFKKSGKAKLIEITRDNHTISWGYSGANIVEAQEQKSNSEELVGNDAFMVLPNLSSTVLYENIYNNVDLEVINSTVGVKENLILKSSNTKNVFKIEYNIGDLVTESVDSHTIELKDADGVVVYTISAPYMVDAEGEMSEAVELKILQNNKGKLSVKLTADKDWLKDKSRVYPVTIDPSVEYGESYTETSSAYISSANPNKIMNQHTNAYVSKTDSNVNNGLFKLNELTELSNGDYIVNASLNVYPMSQPSLAMQLKAYKVTSDWTTATATYNNVTFDSTVVDYAKVTADSLDAITFDITKLMKDWYNDPSSNYGVMLSTDDLAGIELGGHACYYSDCKPMFTITYKNYVGTETDLTYRTHGTGLYGTGYVSDALGTLVLRQELVQESGSRMPVSISATYNSVLFDELFSNGSPTGCGWQMSFNRYISVPSEELQALGYDYIYTDEDGTNHYFTKVEVTEEEATAEDYVESWTDENEFGYTITKTSTNIILDAGTGTKAYFELPANGGKILSEVDDYNNTITYTYTDGNLTKITDGAGREYIISYSTNSVTGELRVSKITSPDSSTVSFTYGTSSETQNWISKIEYSDRETVTFYYDVTTKQINTVQSTCGTKVVYSYNSDRTVSKITDQISGNWLQMNYNTDNTTKIEDKQGRSETYTFDNYGRTVSVLNADGHLENTGGSEGYYLSTGSDSYTKNYITNSYLTSASGYVAEYSDTESTGTFTYDTSTEEVNGEKVQHLGSRSIKINNTDNSQITMATQSISATELAGGDVTFSSYVKTSELTPPLSECKSGAFLKIQCLDASGAVVEEEESYTILGTNNWQRFSVTVNVPDTTATVKVCVGIQNATGTAWFDCLQCESASCMNDFNILNNSDFSGSGSWNGSRYLSGNTEVTRTRTQTVSINKANVSFNITGTASATSVPLNNDERAFGIKLTINYADGTTEEHLQNFNAATTVKQSVNLFVTPEKSNVVISTVAFSFVYDYNVGIMTAYDCMLNFEDNMYTVEESEEETEESTETTEETVSTEPYDGYAYTYDSYGNVLTSSQGTVIPSTDGEDTIDSSKTHITTSTVYDSTGNYVTSETDSRGNTVTYSVDANNGRVNSVTDAKGNVTSYTYDAFGNVLSETSGDVTNTFTYADTGNLTAISHNGFNYSFAYDSYGNSTATSIGSRTLVTNTYGNDNYSLVASTFGNGDVINYTYDDLGNIIRISNEEDVLAEYVYNKKGNVARIIDNASGRITDYWYNVSGLALGTTTYQSDGSVVAYSNDSTDADGNQITVSSVGNVTRVVTQGVDEDDNSYVDNDGWNTTVALDSLGRITNKSTSPNNLTAFTTDYTYVAGSDDNATTELVDSISVKRGSKDIITYSYEYDANGNIRREYQNGVTKYVYTYDSLNQLKNVNNYVNNTYTTYAYDDGGNIVRELVQNLHPTYGYPTTVASDISYTYGDSEWKDLLTEYNGEAITYDTVGNPLTYRDDITMTWQNGRELATLTKDNKTISYTYDANGMRTEKNSDGTVTQYFYDGNNNLTSLKRGDTQLVFYYDTEGQPESVAHYTNYVATRYYYVKNLQGDIVKIVSDHGTVIANYEYDAYGKLLSITNSTGAEITSETSIALLNPFRYRGYVYDDETGFYYLRSRYYDPEIGRFINPDDTAFLGANGKIVDYNLFSYCGNNPVNNIDLCGNYYAEATLLCVLKAVLATIITVAVAYVVYVFGKRYSKTIVSAIKNAINTELNGLRRTILLLFELTNAVAKYHSLKPYEYHHIVPRSNISWSTKAQEVRKIYINAGYSINNSMNIIILKTGIHRKLNSHVYYNVLYGVFSICCYSGQSKTEKKYGVVMALGIMRSILQQLNSLSPY